MTKVEASEFRALRSRVLALEKVTERLAKDLQLAEAFIKELQSTIKRLTKELEGRGPI